MCPSFAAGLPSFAAFPSPLRQRAPAHHARAAVCCASPPRRARKPNGYWKDMRNIGIEVDAFLSASGRAASEMPTAAELRGAKRRDLLNAITNAGGFRSVAEALGRTSARHARKPAGYWNDPGNVAREVREFVAQRGEAGRMPTAAELRDAGRSDVGAAVQRCGGFAAVAAELGLEASGKRREAGYWKEFARVEEALGTFVKERDAGKGLEPDADVAMPTQKELRGSGRADLAQAISEFHGGFGAVSDKMGFQRRNGDWSEFYMLAQEIFRFCRTELDNAPIMPNTRVLKKHKRSDLISAVVKHGGMAAVSERLGLQYQIRTKEVFRDWSVFLRSLVGFTQSRGMVGQLPSSRELRNFGRQDLYQGILYWGGPRAVGEKAGLQVGNYWQYFHFVGEQVLSFVDKHGTPGVMPAESDFMCVGNRTLEVAVAKFGYKQVATRLGLKQSGCSTQSALDSIVDSVLNVDSEGINEKGESEDADDPLQLSSLPLEAADLRRLRELVERQALS